MSTGSEQNPQKPTDADQPNGADDTIDLCYESDPDFTYESASSTDSDAEDVIIDEIKVIETKTKTPEPQVPQVAQPTEKKAQFDALDELRDKNVEELVSIISERLTWLTCHAINDLENDCAPTVDATDVYYVSCALWVCQELVHSQQVSNLLTDDQFDLFLKWTSRLPQSSRTKLAIDNVLCSMYTLKPEMFPKLFETFNIILPLPGGGEQTDRNVEIPHLFIHIRATNIIFYPYEDRKLSTVGCLSLTENQYNTLAQISQSNISALQLIHSGFLALLVDVVIEFCVQRANAATKTADEFENAFYVIDQIHPILKFFSKICGDSSIRMWFASHDIRIFWDSLFDYLCSTEAVKLNEDTPALMELSDSTILFLSKCCSCYPANLEKLTLTTTSHLSQLVRRDDSNVTKISRFGRKLISELIMGTEYIYASVQIKVNRNLGGYFKEGSDPFFPPPNYPPSNKHQFLQLDTNYTGWDIINEVTGENTRKPADKVTQPESLQHIDKKMKVESEETESLKLLLWDSTNSTNIIVEPSLLVSQMLAILINRGNTLEAPLLKFVLTEGAEENCEGGTTVNCTDVAAFSFLKMLTDMNIFRQLCFDNSQTKATTVADELQVSSTGLLSQLNQDVHFSPLLPYYPYEGMVAVAPTQPEKPVESNLKEWSTTPLISLIIHGQCLKLVEYQNEIKKRPVLQSLTSSNPARFIDVEKNKALFCCNPNRLTNPLAVLPLELLRFCFKTSLDERKIRKTAVNNGLIDLLFTLLAVHADKAQTLEEDNIQNRHITLIRCLKQCKNNSVGATDKKGISKKHKAAKQFWPKGVGYGSNYDLGATSLNEQNSLKKRLKSDEEFVAILLQVLASFIHPDFRLYDLYQNYMDEISDLELGTDPELPSEFLDWLERSCLLPVIVDYLRNDSILDILRHVTLYTAIMQLLRCMASNTQTISFLLSNDHNSVQCSTSTAVKFTSIYELLKNMKVHADNYSSNCLTKKADAAGTSFNVSNEIEADEEALIMDIQITSLIINIIKQKYSRIAGIGPQNVNIAKPEPTTSDSNEERYLDVMGKMRFASYDIITAGTGAGMTFSVEYAYHREVNGDFVSAVNHPTRMRRIAQEITTLSTSLPLTFSSTVFVRCDTDRLDVVKVLITGPAGTPYMNGCFEFDVYFPPAYPNVPMLVKLITTGRGSVRFNPNLYENGKVCLSLLNTWAGRPEEKWNSQTSSLIQVLISIQALILVPDPYFNEPGYQSTRGSAQGDTASRNYNHKLLPQTVRWAMLEQIRKPNPCFREVINAHFWLKRKEIIQQISRWMNEEKLDSKSKSSLDDNYKKLLEEFSKLQPPEGMTD